MDSSSIFTRERLGEVNRQAGEPPRVEGDLFNPDWNTICWYNDEGEPRRPANGICDPTTNTGPLLRCPLDNGADPCRNDNPIWPSSADVENAISKPEYDVDTFDPAAPEDSFRNFMEGFERLEGSCPDDDLLCSLRSNKDNRYYTRYLHNAVSFI